MATGASTADLAIILIDARKGILPQTRRHSFIVSMIGVRDVVLAINKMDLIGYSEARFSQIVAAYRDVARTLSFRSITPLPISALNGDNIATLSDRTPWFQGEALLPFLEHVDAGASALAEAPFRFPVQWVNRPNLDFRGFSGWVASGAIRPGDAVVALPSGRASKVARIVTQDGDLDRAVAGQSVTLTLADEIDVSRGDILSSVQKPVDVTSVIEARLLWTAETNMHPGASYVVKLGARSANATVAKVHHLVDIHTFEPTPGRPLGLNEIALAQLRFDRPFALGLYRDNRDLGGFILIDRITNETVAFGLVESATGSSDEEIEPEATGVDWPRIGADLRERLLPSLGSGALIGLGALAFGAPPATALALGLADAAFRPLIRGLYQDFTLALAHRRAKDEVMPDGDGI
jgi:bifunctional enzyme CysN/CysC